MWLMGFMAVSIGLIITDEIAPGKIGGAVDFPVKVR